MSRDRRGNPENPGYPEYQGDPSTGYTPNAGDANSYQGYDNGRNLPPHGNRSRTGNTGRYPAPANPGAMGVNDPGGATNRAAGVPDGLIRRQPGMPYTPYNPNPNPNANTPNGYPPAAPDPLAPYPPYGEPGTDGTPPGGRGSLAEIARRARNASFSISRRLSNLASRFGQPQAPYGSPVAKPEPPAFGLAVMPQMPQGSQTGQTGHTRGVGTAAPNPYRSPAEEQIRRKPSTAYHRSRVRLLARKWRVSRHRAHPVTYALTIASIITVLVLLAAGGGAGTVYSVSYYQRHTGDIQAIASLRDQQNSVIYDRNGKTIYVAKSDSGFQLYAPLQQISTKVQVATLDTEDRTFYSNVGIDFYGTLRAALTDVRAGGAAQGGSTITQQLVKNIVLNDTNQNIQRKLNEAILAYGVTQQYTKSFILEMYLNTIPYGDQNIGIEAAARNFFGLQAKTVNGTYLLASQQLSWAQAAILAGLPNAPSEFLPNQFSCPKAPCQPSQWANPFQGNPADCGAHIPTYGPDWYLNPQNGHEWLVYCRTELVLYNVLQYGLQGHPELHFTQADYDQAMRDVQNILINQQVYSWRNNQNTHADTSADLAPHFVQYIFNVLADQYGITDPSTAGLHIYTTLDLNLQLEAASVIKHYIQQPYIETWYGGNPGGANYFPPLSDPGNANAHNGALVAIDQRNGDILAMVGSVDPGSRDRHIQGDVNITTSIYRSMGSATKPLMYATAFEMGWNPGVMLQDIPICFPVQSPIPGYVDSAAPACKGYYVPHDYEETNFAGTFPLRRQFDDSLNIAATEGMEFDGATPATADAFLAMAQRLGVTTLSANRMGPTTALGGQEIPLLQLTGAYATFANLGKRAPARGILRIEKADGTLLWAAPAFPQATQAISPQAAFMITSVLSDNRARYPYFKYHNPLVLDDSGWGNLAIAGKTGTSSGNGGPNDIVTAGYTPYMTLGVWVGNTDGNDALNPGIIGVTGAGYIFHDVMLWAAQNYHWNPNAQFTIPPDMTRGTFNCNTGLAPYQGSSASQLNCAYNPFAPATSNNPYDPSGLFSSDRTHMPDSDWYIQDEAPLVS